MAAEIIKGRQQPEVHYVPGEHEIGLDAPARPLKARHGDGTKGDGWYSFEQPGGSFRRPGERGQFQGRQPHQPRGGSDRLAEGRRERLARRKQPIWSSPIFRCGPSSPRWGWGTEMAAGPRVFEAFRFGDVFERPYPPGVQKVEGNVAFHTARSTAFPQPVAGTAPAPGPKLVPADQLRSLLGLSELTFARGKEQLADRRSHAGVVRSADMIHLPEFRCLAAALAACS